MADIQKRQTIKGVRWTSATGTTATGRRKRSFARKVDAQHFANSVETDLLRGDWIDPRRGQELFGEWAGNWLTTIGDKKPKTRESYESIVNKHLLHHGSAAATRTGMVSCESSCPMAPTCPSTPKINSTTSPDSSTAGPA